MKNNLKKNNPLISIIINCFNGQKYLKECVESVLNQSYTNWEIIFWDNLSTDLSKKIIQNYTDKRIKYYCAKKFSNLYKARNLAIKKSKGEFISFLDVDDFWFKDKLKKQIAAFKINKKTNVVYGNCILKNDYHIFKKKKYYKQLLPSGKISDNLLREYCIPLPTLIIKRKALDKLKFIFNKNYKIIGDFDLCIRLSVNNIFMSIQEPLAVYRIHGENYSQNFRRVEIKELMNWYKNANKGLFGNNLKNNKYLVSIKNRFYYLTIMVNCLEKNIFQSLKKIFVGKLSLMKKIKFLIILFLPKQILKRIAFFVAN